MTTTTPISIDNDPQSSVFILHFRIQLIYPIQSVQTKCSTTGIHHLQLNLLDKFFNSSTTVQHRHCTCELTGSLQQMGETSLSAAKSASTIFARKAIRSQVSRADRRENNVFIKYFIYYQSSSAFGERGGGFCGCRSPGKMRCKYFVD